MYPDLAEKSTAAAPATVLGVAPEKGYVCIPTMCYLRFVPQFNFNTDAKLKAGTCVPQRSIFMPEFFLPFL
jgi:hypothetical protein